MTTVTLAPVTDADLAALCDAVNAKRAAYWERAGYTSPRALCVFEKGPRYARLILEGRTASGEVFERSAYGFVELSTGILLKAAGWKGPAKGPRGHISGGAGPRCSVYSIG